MTQEQKNVSIPGVTVNTSISTFPAPVGIGASDPQSVLHIVSQSPVVKVEDTASGSTANPNIQFLASDGIMGFVGYTGSGMQLLNALNTPLVISTNNLERVRITQSGNMGIGMTAPTTALGVSGSGSFSGIVSASGISTVGATFAGNISVGGVTVSGGVSAGSFVSSATIPTNPQHLTNKAYVDSKAPGLTFAGNISVNGVMVGIGNGDNTNLAVGNGSPLGNNTTGKYNTALGITALGSNLSGQRNTSVGYYSLGNNQSGQSNVAVGIFALLGVTSGGANTAIGDSALFENTASNNTAIGDSSLENNTTGTENIAMGGNALSGNTSGNFNTAVGYSSLGNNKADSNTAVGNYALSSNQTGANNTAVGKLAGQGYTTTTGGVFIGSETKASANGTTNEIVIGTDALGLGSNTAVIGKTTQIAATIYGLVTASLGVTAPRMFTSSMTASTLHVTGVTTLVGVTATTLNVTGVSTLAGVTASNLYVSGGLTAAASLSVVGVSTLAGVTAQSLFLKNGLTAAGSLGVVGNITIGRSIGELIGGMSQISNMSFISNGTNPTFNRIVVGTDGTGYKFAISTMTASSSIIDRLTIVDNGFVGIGQNSPAYALDVTGTIRASTNLIVSGNVNVGGVTTLVGVTADSMFVKGGITAGTVSATTFNGTLNGNANTATLASLVTTNANLSGDVTSSGNTTVIAPGVIVNADINANAAITDTKLDTIATTGKVSNSATTATSAPATANAIVARDPSGGFVAAGITATSINVSSYQLASSGFNNQIGTAYTILATDNGKIVTGSSTSAITFTLPAAAIGFSVTIIQSNTGSITIKPNGTDTLNSFGKTSTAGLTTGGQWAAVDVVCVQANTWVLFGNLA